MKYAITGSSGHVSKPLALRLLKEGHDVVMIGRNENNLKELERAGAQISIGSLEDASFLKKAFAGARAVYTMCPPNYLTNNLKKYHEQLAANYVKAIRANGIQYVVNLSSIGAHLSQGAGPVSAMHRAEKILNMLTEVNIKHLRPAYFYTNLMSNINMIKNMGIIGNNFSNNGKQFPVSDAEDIATVAAEELTLLNFSGHSFRYIASDETDTEEIATVIGNAIDRPGLKWQKFTDEQTLEGFLRAGFPKETAADFVELGNAIDSGKMFEDYRENRPGKLGAVKLADFITLFTTTYKAN